MQNDDKDFLSPLSHISDIVGQLKGIRIKSKDTSYVANELASWKMHPLEWY
jgi:hypothetical protein